VPRFDVSRGGAYPAVAFKDDAPANASLTDFAAPFIDGDGRPVDPSAFRGRKVVVVVLRGMPQSAGGTFCPSCVAQAGSLLAHRDEFNRRDAEVVVVYPGPDDRLGEFLQTARSQAPGEPERWFRVWLDRECRACDRLGIRDDLAKPSTYVLDTQGRPVYAYVGTTTTDRPSVKAVLAQLDRTP
jgi:peroxiredoxin